MQEYIIPNLIPLEFHEMYFTGFTGTKIESQPFEMY